MHWLHSAAKQAQLPGIDALDIQPGAPVASSWLLVEQATGLSARELLSRLAPPLCVACADLECADASARALVPEALLRQHHVFPLRVEKRRLVVATSDPTDLDAEQAISFASGKRVVFELATHAEVAEALDVAFSAEHAIERLLEKVDAADAENVRFEQERTPEELTLRDVESAPIVKLASLMLADAIRQGASDIHVEPRRGGGGMVRFRVDGVLRSYMDLPPSALSRVVSRLKVLGDLDITDRLRPQDGRARISIGERAYDLRISTVPTREAEKAVVRVLQDDTLRSLDEMRLSEVERLRLLQLLACREGLVVVTGPTGSGKTTTLYAALKSLSTGTLNVMTVEDPVEYELPGITQLQVDVKTGLTFATALRSILRQDPDVILVGEVRDAETAAIAAQASLTGHLVLATLHANDAMGAVMRLAELGLDRATISATLRGCVAQRLLRRLCPDCAEPVGELNADEQRLAATYGAAPTHRAVGCPRCALTGYQGRLPIAEVALVTPALADDITKGHSPQMLQQEAIRQGMAPMRALALARVAGGETTLQEVERVLGDAPVESPTPAKPKKRARKAAALDTPPAPVVVERRGRGADRRGTKPRRA